MELHAVIEQDDKIGFQAQVLEIDIAARGNTMERLLREIGYAITMEYRIAKERGAVPFANLKPAPSEFHGHWEQAAPAGENVHALHLPQDVAEALAIHLHAQELVFSIRHFYRAAA